MTDTSQDMDAPRPRYARIQKILEDRLIDGIYPVGSLIPTEVELASEFSTSRFTVREALRYLHERGYVDRRQGVGTRVLTSTPKQDFSLSIATLDELLRVTSGTFFEVLSVEPITLDDELAEIAGGDAGEHWLQMDGIRWTKKGGSRICYVRSYLPKQFEALVPQIYDVHGPVFEFLQHNSDQELDHIVQEIRAVPMPADIAEQLDVKTDAPWALQLLRRYVSQTDVLITSLNWHPSDQMTYVMRIDKRDQSAD